MNGRTPLTATDRRLAAADPALGEVILATRLPRLPVRHDPFHALLRAILAQQLSKQAADAIEGRLLGLFPDDDPTPDGLLALAPSALRDAGLSGRKVEYVTGLARHALSGELDRQALERLDNSAVIERVTALHGIGRWTAEMLLMFCLRRADVFPVDDVGIERAMQQLYPLPSGARERRARMGELAEAWRPWRSRACRYLWAWRRNRPL